MEQTAPVATPAAPAQPVAPSTLSATHAAVAAGDTSQYREARRAERAGKPLPSVPVTAEPATAPPADGTPATPTTPATPVQPTVSKRQQEVNESIRRATEKAVADATRDANAEIARLRAAQATPAPAAPAQPAPAAPTEPDWKRYAAMPDAPNIDDFQSINEHAAAMSLFVADKRHEERQAQEQGRTQQEQFQTAQRARYDGFGARLQAAKTADPEFVNKLTPDVKALKPFAALEPGDAGGPLNVVAEQVFDSEIADKVLLHFSEHPDALKRFETMPAHIAAMPPGVRVKAHMQWIVKEFGKLEAKLDTPSAPAAPPPPQPKTLSDAPEPSHALGNRPSESTDPMTRAIRSNDTRAYRDLKRQQRAASIGR